MENKLIGIIKVAHRHTEDEVRSYIEGYIKAKELAPRRELLTKLKACEYKAEFLKDDAGRRLAKEEYARKLIEYRELIKFYKIEEGQAKEINLDLLPWEELERIFKDEYKTRELLFKRLGNIRRQGATLEALAKYWTDKAEAKALLDCKQLEINILRDVKKFKGVL